MEVKAIEEKGATRKRGTQFRTEPAAEQLLDLRRSVRSTLYGCHLQPPPPLAGTQSFEGAHTIDSTALVPLGASLAMHESRPGEPGSSSSGGQGSRTTKHLNRA